MLGNCSRLGHTKLLLSLLIVFFPLFLHYRLFYLRLFCSKSLIAKSVTYCQFCQLSSPMARSVCGTPCSSLALLFLPARHGSRVQRHNGLSGWRRLSMKIGFFEVLRADAVILLQFVLSCRTEQQPLSTLVCIPREREQG